MKGAVLHVSPLQRPYLLQPRGSTRLRFLQGDESTGDDQRCPEAGAAEPGGSSEMNLVSEVHSGCVCRSCRCCRLKSHEDHAEVPSTRLNGPATIDFSISKPVEHGSRSSGNVLPGLTCSSLTWRLNRLCPDGNFNLISPPGSWSFRYVTLWNLQDLDFVSGALSDESVRLDGNLPPQTQTRVTRSQENLLAETQGTVYD